MASFTESIDAWVAQTKERLDAVHGRSVELLGEELAKTKPEGGRVPFMTGNLARSLLASKSGMPNTTDGPYAGSNIGLIAATLKADETVYIGYQAKYAARQEFGFVGNDALGRTYNQSGNHFVEGAIAEWPAIVKRAVESVKRGN